MAITVRNGVQSPR